MRLFTFASSVLLAASSLVSAQSGDFLPSTSLGSASDGSSENWTSDGSSSFRPSLFPFVYNAQLTPDPAASRGAAENRQFTRRRTLASNRSRRPRRLGPVTNRQGSAGSPRCGPGGVGECRNFMGCMMAGRRLDWRSGSGFCSGVFQVCCVPRSVRPPLPTLQQHQHQQQAPRRHPSATRQARRRPKKAGRALLGAGPQPQPHPVQSPSVIRYYTSPEVLDLQNDFSLNALEDGSTNQWHTHSVVANDGVDCGLSKNAHSRIMGGLDAGYGQFPWTAHIKIKGPGIDKVCGGTLVNSRWVVTAGHCTQYCQDGTQDCSEEVSQLSIQYKVIMGEYDQLSQLEEYPTESYLAVEVIRHPEYQNVKRYHYRGYFESEPRYDVALLKLDRDVRVAPSVAPICLPSLGDLPMHPGAQATVVGWGRTGRDEDSPHSNILQAVTIPVLAEDDCARQTGLGVYSDQMCAGGSDALMSACPGDSGGGLQVRDDRGRWTLVGVVSNGPSSCGTQPVIFHKLRKSLPWMIKMMQRNTLDDIRIQLRP